ncbi:hypothetical protein GCM10023321_83350 [Pseudonocardia eucalypti]|uniref:Uncharacterized protein n=1 Tax=Pseudonocardia eucalypti TaxID=648755 RepID=A0ABP9RFY5_9PSEU|nr:hypothetical protein [Pseudonocardia eucalypti]
MVRYQGDNERPGEDEFPRGVPARSDQVPAGPTIFWALLLLAAVIVFAFVARHGAY